MLGRVRRELDRPVVGAARIVRAAGAGQEIGAGGVVRLVLIDDLGVDGVERGEAGIRSGQLGDRGSPTGIDIDREEISDRGRLPPEGGG